MRNFRNAAIAGATAVALTFGGASVATADEASAKDDTAASSQQNDKGGSSDRSWQTGFGHLIGNDHKTNVKGEDLWGKKRNPEATGQAAEVLRGLSIALGVFAGLTFLVAPAYNFIKFGPFA